MIYVDRGATKRRKLCPSLKWYGHIQQMPLESLVHRRIVRRANTVKRGSRAQTNLTREEFVKRYLMEYLKKRTFYYYL